MRADADDLKLFAQAEIYLKPFIAPILPASCSNLHTMILPLPKYSFLMAAPLPYKTVPLGLEFKSYLYSGLVFLIKNS